MGCKGITNGIFQATRLDLIETYWDVKKCGKNKLFGSEKRFNRNILGCKVLLRMRGGMLERVI